MKNNFAFIALIVQTLVSIFCNSSAQVYPIQASVSITPPYSTKLSDYVNSASDQIQLHIRSNDNTLNSFQVRLRLAIEGVNITVRTKNNFYPGPLVIDNISPLTLTGRDLEPYFSVDNLDFISLSKAEYVKTGRLPDGVYRYTIEVLDYNRLTVISNKATATAWCFLNDPVLLNLPANATKIRIVDPTNISFSWTPRHTSSVNSAFSCEYTFRLVELAASDRNPNDAMLSHPILFEAQTSNSQILYGPEAPMLLPGRWYAWQVITTDLMGRDLFRNAGRSEVFTFQFGDAIAPPENLRQEFSNARTISIRWDPPMIGAQPATYKVEHKLSDADTWYSDRTANAWFTLTGLEADRKYIVKIRSEDPVQVSDYTAAKVFETTVDKAIEGYECGGPRPILDSLKNTAPLLNLSPGDVFRCYDFDIRVQQITASNSDGLFTGFGWMGVKAFNEANIYVQFKGKFNSQYILVEGGFESVSAPNSVISSMIDEMKKIGEERKTTNVDSSETLNPKQLFEPYIIEGIVDSISLVEGKIIVLTEDGAQLTFENKSLVTGEPVVVKDAAGTIYTIRNDGNVEKAGTNIVNSPTPKSIDTSQLTEWELLVKDVIDSMYSINVSFRDSVMEIKKDDQKKLDDLVKIMEAIERSVIDEVPQIELDISVVALMTDIEVMDSIVQISVDKINANERKLTTLNQMLDDIHDITKEIDSAERLKTLGVLQRRFRIAFFIQDKLKQ